MKSYIIQVPVNDVHGHQTFCVIANSEKKALEKLRRDGGLLVGEELEVTSLDWNAGEVVNVADIEEEPVEEVK